MRRRSQSSHADRTAIACVLGSACLLAAFWFPGIGLAEDLFVSKQLTPGREYNRGIEGPAVNAAGDLFVVSFKKPGAVPGSRRSIGQVKKGTAQSRFFGQLPDGGRGSGIRFDLQGHMYVADFNLHTIHVFEAGSTDSRPYFAAAPDPQHPAKPAFNQPNDLAIARDGTLYASDPKGDGTGRIWKITKDATGNVTGEIMTSTSAATRPQGKTNGLDLSPDEKKLYVSESRFNANGVVKKKAAVYAYRIDGLKLADERLVFEFPDNFDVDGLRVDTDGRIFVARPEAGQVVILMPAGAVGTAPPPVNTKGKNPNNLTFGGADGRDVYVTQNTNGQNGDDDSKRFIERFRTDRPGREPCLQASPPPDCRAIAQ